MSMTQLAKRKASNAGVPSLGEKHRTRRGGDLLNKTLYQPMRKGQEHPQARRINL